jgi:hypothetical protein
VGSICREGAYVHASKEDGIMTSLKDNYDEALNEFMCIGWASTRCPFCEPIRIVSRETALTVFPPTSVPLHINPQTCSYTHVAVEGKIYRRIVEDEKNCVEVDGTNYWNNLPRHCHDCGIVFGNVHHANCDVERCPKCDGQFIGCPCDKGNYFMGTGDLHGKSAGVTESMEDYFTRKYSEDREEGLRISFKKALKVPSMTQNGRLVIDVSSSADIFYRYSIHKALRLLIW